jgi:hypothetical protein
MSTSEKEDHVKKSVGRTKRYYVQEKFNHENIQMQIELHKKTLDRYSVSEIKYTCNCEGVVTLAMFSASQVYAKNWIQIFKTIFGVEGENRTADQISSVVSYLEHNVATKVCFH